MSTLIKEALAKHRLPTIWALWAEYVTIDVQRNLSDQYMVDRPEPPGPTVEEWEYDLDGDAVPVERPRTPDEMTAATKLYEQNLAEWVAAHGDALTVMCRYRAGPETFEVKVAGPGRAVSLIGSAERGPWMLVSCVGIGWHEVEEAVEEETP